MDNPTKNYGYMTIGWQLYGDLKFKADYMQKCGDVKQYKLTEEELKQYRRKEVF